MTRAGRPRRRPRPAAGGRPGSGRDGDFRSRSSTLSHPDAGNSSSGAAQLLAPALLTSTCSAPVCPAASLASRWHSSSRDRSAGIAQICWPCCAGRGVPAQFGGGLVAGLRLTRRDGDRRPRLHEAARDHQADTARTARDRRLPGQIKQSAHMITAIARIRTPRGDQRHYSPRQLPRQLPRHSSRPVPPRPGRARAPATSVRHPYQRICQPERTCARVHQPPLLFRTGSGPGPGQAGSHAR